jgi:hypothetical protein
MRETSERRKLPPSPILRARDVAPRSLAPSAARTFTLPTAAAVAALLLSAAGCTAPTGEHIHRDEPRPAATETTKSAPTTAASATAGTIGGASMVPAIDPDPEQMDGQMAMVLPKSKIKTTPAPTSTPPHIAPVAKPMPLGGDVAPTSP